MSCYCLMGNRQSTILYTFFLWQQSDCHSVSAHFGRVFCVFTFLSVLPTFFYLFLSLGQKKKEGKGVGQRGKGESNRNVSVLMGLQLPLALDVGLRLCRFCCLVLLLHSCLFSFSWKESLEPIGC